VEDPVRKGIGTLKLDISPTASTLTAHEIERLVAEEKLLRILCPDLQNQVQQAVKTQHEGSEYVLEHNGHLYISCAQIEDPDKRKQTYHLLQRYQLGERVSLTRLPPELQQILQPQLTPTGRFLGSLLMGGGVGIICGVLAMSIAILLTISSDWINEQPMLAFSGMGFTAVTFIVFSIMGWAAGAFIAWRRHWQWRPPIQ
jgi:hypothetical protein